MTDYDEPLTGEELPSPDNNLDQPGEPDYPGSSIESGDSEAAYRDSEGSAETYSDTYHEAIDAAEAEAQYNAYYEAHHEVEALVEAQHAQPEVLPEVHDEAQADLSPLPDQSVNEPPVRLTRIEELTAAIERYPDSPVNYVLRGEALLVDRNLEEAFTDFQLALHLIEARAETDKWEYIDRALADRATLGLRRIQRE